MDKEILKASARFDPDNPDSVAEAVVNLANETGLHPVEILEVIDQTGTLSVEKICAVALLLCTQNKQMLEHCVEVVDTGDPCCCGKCNIARVVTWCLRDDMDFREAVQKVRDLALAAINTKPEEGDSFSA